MDDKQTEKKEGGAVVETPSESSAEGASSSSSRPKKKMTRRAWAACAVAAAIVLVAGAGFWFWHEQPSFCNAFCHTPMDPYLPTYEAEPGTMTQDKWGNEVNASAMMAPIHRVSAEEGGADAICVDCHVPTLSEQVGEVMNWTVGNYLDPIDERSMSELLVPRGLTSDEFCMNENCHNVTREELAAALGDIGARNPHSGHHGDERCDSCHKGHRASVNMCTKCHSDAPVPEGWISYAEEYAILNGQS